MICSPTDFTHRSYGAFKGVHLSPLGFAACQSKKCTNTTKSTFSHRIQNTFLLGYSPTDFTDLHRTFLLRKLPQISQNTQNFLAEIFSHRFHFLMRDSPTDFTHRSYGAFKGVHLSQVHQHNKIYILPQNSEHILAEIFSHRFHRFTQNFLAEKNSVKSVDSVGSIHTLTSVRICEICGSFFNCKLRAVSQGPEHEKTNLFLLICSPTDFSF